MNPSDNQINNNNKPWLWKKGQSGNPAGRPKGKTMKEYVKDYLSKMTDEERDTFMEGIPKEIIWKMGEGNPETNSDLNVKGDLTIAVSEAIVKKHANTTPPGTESSS